MYIENKYMEKIQNSYRGEKHNKQFFYTATRIQGYTK